MQSEQEYLSSYTIGDYERPSVAADVAAFMIRREDEDSYRKDPAGNLSILLVKRAEHPFLGSWALPGGFLRSSETIEECALREITEETNVTPASIMPIGVFSEIDRDPRGRIISNAFASIISEDFVNEIGGDDAEAAAWFRVRFEQEQSGRYILVLSHNEINLKAALEESKSRFGKMSFKIIDAGGIAFDHAKIIAAALTALRNEAKNFEGLFDFLPEKFTLTALQKVQETIMGISVLPANFRRKAAEYVVETDEYTTGAGHRPAKLYRKK